MALTYAEKLVELGMPPEQAKVLIAAVTAGTPDFDAAVAAAVAAKTEIAALDNQSDAEAIVAALQA